MEKNKKYGKPIAENNFIFWQYKLGCGGGYDVSKHPVMSWQGRNGKLSALLSK